MSITYKQTGFKQPGYGGMPKPPPPPEPKPDEQK